MINIKYVSKSYLTGETKTEVLKNINVKLNKGEFISIFGPSGSGKSTLMNLIGGLDRVSSGEIVFNDRSIQSFSDSELDKYRNENIGFVFQNFNLLDHFTALENVELSLKLAGYGIRKIRKRAKELLRLVGLEDHMNKKPTKLSGGEQQRVAIARALATDPDVILADEPTGALDSKTSVEILELLKEISNLGKLVIVVTHDNEVANWSSRIINVRDGRIISDEDKEVNKDISDYKLSKIESKNRKISVFFALTVALKNIYNKLVQNLLLIFATSLTLAVILMVLSINNNAIKAISQRIDLLSFNPKLLEVSENDAKINNIGDLNELINYQDEVESNINFFNNLDNVSGAYFERINVNAFLKVDYNDETLQSIKTYSVDDYVHEVGKKVIIGNQPTNKNEILIPASVVKEVYGLSILLKDDKVEIEKLIGNEVEILFTDQYKSLTYMSLVRNNPDFNLTERSISKKYTISGIVQDSGYQTLIYVYPESLREINGYEYVSRKGQTKYMNIYPSYTHSYVIYTETDNYEDISKAISDIKSFNPRFEVFNEVIKYESVARLLTNIQYAFVGFIGLSIVITILMISIIQFVSVIQRKREIGIFRALGASKKDIRLIFTFEAAIITSLAVILAQMYVKQLTPKLLEILFNFFRNNGFSYREAQYYTQFRVTLEYVPMLLLIAISIGVIASLVPSIKASKLDPIESLRAE